MKKEIINRYKMGGITALTDTECFEMLTGKPCKDKVKSLREAIDNSTDIKVKLMKDIYIKFLEQKMIRQRIFCRSSKEVFNYLYADMRGKEKEVFKVIYLNAQNVILKAETIFEGTLTSTSIYPREIVKNAIKYNAAGLIFAHNHPSGEIEPSDSDKSITKNLTVAGKIMEIKVLDHIIIGENKYFSFADEGLIKEYEVKAKMVEENPLEKMIKDIKEIKKKSQEKSKGNEMEL